MKPSLLLVVVVLSAAVTVHADSADSEPSRQFATGDWGGARRKLTSAGIDIQAGWVVDVLGNPVGGDRQAAAYAGLLQLDAGFDMGKLLGADGLTLYVSGTWGSGTNLSAEIGNVFQVGEAYVARTVRLSQLFLAQSLAGGAVRIKIGRVSVANDFAFVPVDQYFVNAALNGNPLSIAINDPGFVQDPVVQWGGRVAIRPARGFYAQLGVYDARPVVTLDDEGGLDFSFFDGGVFAIAEVGLESNAELWGRRRRGHFKLGAYHDNSRFSYLSDPGQSRVGQYGFYFMAQHELFREGARRTEGASATTRARIRSAQAEDPIGARQGLSTWLALAFSPVHAISPMPTYVSAGIGYRGLFPGREGDMTTVSATHGRFSRELRGRSWETVLEVNYRLDVARWLYLTPDFQYVFSPGGGGLPDAIVVGFETTITF